MGVRGPKSKIEEQRFVEGVMENRWPKMARFHRETKKKIQFEVCDRQTDRQTDRQRDGDTDRVNDKNNRLLG